MRNSLIIILALNILVEISGCSSQNKKDAADFFLKGNQALSQKNYAEAIRFYDEAIAKNADFSDAYLNKGITLLKLEQAEKAAEVLTEAINIDPTLVQANLVRAESMLRLGQLREASEDLKHIEKQYTDSSTYHLLKGNLLQAQSNPTQAIPEYDRAISLDKRNVEAYINRGAVYYGLQSYGIAKIDFESAIVLEPAQPQALNNLGLIFMHEQQWASALSCFDKILNRNPADAYALNNKGYALMQSGSPEKAKELIDKSLEILPENGYALRNLGIYFRETGQNEKALEAFNRAIDIAEPVDMLYGLAGQTYFDQKKAKEACEIWKKGATLKDSISIASVAKYCR